MTDPVELSKRLRGHVADYEADLAECIAAKILPDRAAYGDDQAIPVGEIIEAADTIDSLTAKLAEAERALDAITDLERYTRSGGPDLSDLSGLSDGLNEACQIAATTLNIIRGNPSPPGTEVE